MTTTWILVANASSASIYMNKGPKRGLEKIKTYEHAASREKASDLVSDRPGHYKSAGNGHGAYVPPTDPKQNEAQQFAMKLTRELEQGRTANEFQRLIIVAPPQFMGLINGNASTVLKGLVTDHFEKDYTKVDEKTLAGHLEGCIFL
ncbi:MAG TPA: host attachment protein [Burkholderiales bacterium]|nr:host attachment protein [Burkholderiales bacterium]